MSQNIKNILNNIQNNSLNLSKLMYRINVVLDIWKGNYGASNYWKGLNSAGIDYRKKEWVEVFNTSLTIYKELESNVDELLKIYNKNKYLDKSIVTSFQQEFVNNSLLTETLVNSLTNLYVEDQEAVKTFCDSIKRVSYFGHSIHKFVEMIQNSYFDRAADTASKEVEETTNKSFKEQLEDFVVEQKKKENDVSSYDKWVSNQYSFLKNAASPYTHLLQKDLKYGICEVPVFLSNAYMDKANMSRLRQVGYKLSKMLGNYILIENALLFGIKIEELEDQSQFFQKWEELIKEQVVNARNGSSTSNVIVNNNLVPVGPLVKKMGHLYSLLIPKDFVSNLNSRNFVLKSWDINIR